jgi:hypothetical protein
VRKRWSRSRRRTWSWVTALAVIATAGGLVQAPPAVAADETVARLPLADATLLLKSGSTNYGGDKVLMVDSSPARRFVMRLDISVPAGKALKSAILSLTCVDNADSGGVVDLVGDTWTESAVTWNSAPAFGTQVATMGAVRKGTRYQIDLTQAAKDAAAQGLTTLSLGWRAVSDDGAQFASREGSASQKPSLALVFGDPTDPGPAPGPGPGPGGDDPDPDPVPGPGPAPGPAPVETFELGLIGDTPYTSSQAKSLVTLEKTMNDADLSYVVHIGDIKSETDSCPDSVYTSNRDLFDKFADPFIYTPGDNEWANCPDKAGPLSMIRRTFWPTGAGSPTLGVRKETPLRQSDVYPENARWTKGGIVFATIHSVGGSNGGSGSERTARVAADIAWLRAAFDEGERIGARGVVIMTHANWGEPYGTSAGSSFSGLKQALEEEVVAWGKPVVFVHGDTHHFRIDHPMESNGHTVTNFTRVEVYAGSSHWVRLRIVAAPVVFEASSADG